MKPSKEITFWIYWKILVVSFQWNPTQQQHLFHCWIWEWLCIFFFCVSNSFHLSKNGLVKILLACEISCELFLHGPSNATPLEQIWNSNPSGMDLSYQLWFHNSDSLSVHMDISYLSSPIVTIMWKTLIFEGKSTLAKGRFWYLHNFP